MNKNYMKEVAELLDVKLEEEFYIIGEFDYFKFSDTGLFQYDSDLDRWVRTNGYVLGRLLQNELKIERYILNQKEQDYLRDVIRPFRDKVNYIRKESCYSDEYEYLIISVKADKCFNEYNTLPSFKTGTMYKNMKLSKEYSLEELGL
jgi:hypothetical protein